MAGLVREIKRFFASVLLRGIIRLTPRQDTETLHVIAELARAMYRAKD